MTTCPACQVLFETEADRCPRCGGPLQTPNGTTLEPAAATAEAPPTPTSPLFVATDPAAVSASPAAPEPAPAAALLEPEEERAPLWKDLRVLLAAGAGIALCLGLALGLSMLTSLPAATSLSITETAPPVAQLAPALPLLYPVPGSSVSIHLPGTPTSAKEKTSRGTLSTWSASAPDAGGTVTAYNVGVLGDPGAFGLHTSAAGTALRQFASAFAAAVGGTPTDQHSTTLRGHPAYVFTLKDPHAGDAVHCEVAVIGSSLYLFTVSPGTAATDFNSFIASVSIH